jgi:hypothetical protein
MNDPGTLFDPVDESTEIAERNRRRRAAENDRRKLVDREKRRNRDV